MNVEELVRELDALEKQNKGMRLTKQQKQRLLDVTSAFIERVVAMKSKRGFEFSEEYELYEAVLQFLDKKPYSLYICMECMSIERYSRDIFDEEGRHECRNFMFENGFATNWKSLYLLLVKSSTLRKELNKIQGDSESEND